MPTYQYECQACGHEFEELQSMTDKKLTKCPKCGKNKLVRLIGSGTGLIFKGSGFYETDYKKKSSSSDSKKESKPASPAGPAKSGAGKSATPAASPTPCGGACTCHPH